MGFVREKAPEEIRKKYGYMGWTVDRGRDVWLAAQNGGGPQSNVPFVLHRYSDGLQVANFVANEGSTVDKKDILFKLLNLNVALELCDQVDYILQWITEALQCHPFSPARPPNRKVVVEIPDALREQARNRLSELKMQGIITEH